MEIKKSKKANIDEQRGKAFLLGLVIALALLFAALEYTFSPDSYISADHMPDDVLEELALTPAMEPDDMVAAAPEEKPAVADKVKAVETLSENADNAIDDKSLMLVGEADALLARSSKIQGKVVVSFIVNKDGSIASPEVQKSADPLLDREALRVIHMMPHWKPGIMDSKPCRTMFAIPVVFSL